jgi:rod shape-determining protein MreC
MYNIVRFLIRYHLFLLFIFLEGISIYLVSQNSRFHKAAYLNTANAINGSVFKIYNDATGYLFLGKVNDSLANENARLRAMLMQSKLDGQVDTLIDTDTLNEKLMQRFTYIPAKVIRNSIDNANNVIYINRGSNQGISNQMGVINMNGIVGQVIDVTENYAAVMSVLNKDFKVSAKLKKNNYFGNLRWNGNNASDATIDEMPKHVPVQVGDTLVTSGFSTLFPEGIVVGYVSKVKSEVDKPFLVVSVKLSTNFRNLNYVYVVNDLQRKEILKLDTTSTKPTK